jgi:hypothetical protein
MLKQVQHDKMVWFRSCCHPEPGPELASGSKDFAISILGLENLGFKAPPSGRGCLFNVRPALPILPSLTDGNGRRKNGTKAGLALSIASGEERVFDEDFSQISKRGD